jgi:hypothetical protein
MKIAHSFLGNVQRKYWGLKNMKSIDGLPIDFAPDSMAPPR